MNLSQEGSCNLRFCKVGNDERQAPYYLPVTQGKYHGYLEQELDSKLKEGTYNFSHVKTTVFFFFSCQDSHCVNYPQAYNLNNLQMEVRR